MGMSELDLGSAVETAAPRWRRGDQIQWTYTNPAHPGLLDQRPVTVIADDERHLAVWLAPRTRMLHQVLADGRGIREIDGPARFGAARAQGIKEWQGKGIVAVLQPGADYSVWFFETSNGRRDSFYVNIEVPFTRLERGIVSSDLILDLVVRPDRSYHLKDEDELEFALEAGMFTSKQVARIRSAAQTAIDDVRKWRFPFDSEYLSFQPDPEWPLPSLPTDAKWTFEN